MYIAATPTGRYPTFSFSYTLYDDYEEEKEGTIDNSNSTVTLGTEEEEEEPYR